MSDSLTVKPVYSLPDGTLVEMLNPEDRGLFEELYPGCALVRRCDDHKRLAVPASDLTLVSNAIV